MDGKKIIIIAVGVLALTGVGLGIFAFTKSRKLKKQSGGDGGNTSGGDSGNTSGQSTPPPQNDQPTQQVDVNYNQPEPPASSASSGENPFATTDELKHFKNG